jgi:hypothetical protein
MHRSKATAENAAFLAHPRITSNVPQPKACKLCSIESMDIVIERRPEQST